LSIPHAEPNLREFEAKCDPDHRDFSLSQLGEIFPALLEFGNPSEAIDEESIHAYKFCMAFIGNIYEYIEPKGETIKESISKEEDSQKHNSNTRRLSSAFGAMSPPKFTQVVSEGPSRAVVILAHYFAIMKAVDDGWWLRGVPEREVLDIQSILPE